MSSVLHPVGPEPRERYWVRRLAVLVAAVVVIGVVVALVGNAMSAGSAVQAEPAPPPVVVPTVPTTPSASPTPAASGSPTPGATPTAAATPGTATPSASDSASPTPTDTVTPDPGQTPKAERSTPPTSTDKKKDAAEKAAQKKAAEQKKAKKAPVLASCPTGDVRTTLTGPRTVKTGKKAEFDLSLINGSKATCYLKASADNFTLTVVSGKDRIWSSDDCAKVVPSQSRKLSPQKSVDWSMTWDGKRSAPGCKTRSESPKAGYYWAIASFDDATEVRWRLILT
jgi:hypothetical protein